MELKKDALPIHKDATMKIRPRIFLEGNYFVDIRPGTPSSPTLGDGDRIPITQTATPVQLDQILDALDENTRQGLKDVLNGYGTALTYKPSAADDRTQDPSVRGQTAAQALNDSLKNGPDALKGAAVVNSALLGTQPGDLRKLVSSFGKVAGALDRNEAQLQDLITNFNTTMAALASQEGNLRASIRELGPTVESADRAFASLNAAFPPTRAFAREILPGVRETPATINASFPWIDQTRRLLSAGELRGLAQQLSPATRDLSTVTDQTIALLPQVDLLNRCVTDIILPTGNVHIDDGALSTGVENYKELEYGLTGLAGEGQGFDGNGMYVRVQPGGGDQTVSSGKTGGTGANLLANVVQPPLGTRPKYPGHRSPYKPDFPCYRNQRPDLNGPAAAVGGAEVPIGPAAAAAAPASASAASRKRATRARAASSGGTLAGELASRLNPFRAERGGR
jgi:ABC-type transporter Mla subunit MlaD